MTAILKRKLAEAQGNSAGREMTALRALRLSVARAGDDLFDLPLGVAGVRQQRMAPDDMFDVMSDDDLLMVLDCPGGLTGAVSVSLPLVACLIQQQTMGVVSDRAPAPRPFTDTDAAMCAPLVEGVLARAATLAEAEMDQGCFRSIRFGARGEDVRSMVLGLRAPRYRLFWLTLDIALGRHQATVVLALPDTEKARTDAAHDPAADAARAGHSPLMDVPAEVQAILARFRLSVNELNGLTVGDSLPLPRDRLDDTALVSVTGATLVRGRLGQMNGSRAVRLMGPQSIPRATAEAREAMFDPLSAPGGGASGAMSSGEADFDPPARTPSPSGVLGLDEEMGLTAMEALSPMEAADQISQLAGLSAEDFASDTDIPFAATSPDDLEFPTNDLDVSFVDQDDKPT